MVRLIHSSLLYGAYRITQSPSAKSQATHALRIPSLLQREGSKYPQSRGHLFCYQLHLLYAESPPSTPSIKQSGEKGSSLLKHQARKQSA